MLEKVEQTAEDIATTLKESTRPIRALNRGLEVLIELNRLQRAAINTLAVAVGLPRTTTYRVLETLRMAGYVYRDRHDDCYVPTIMVRALSGGFDEEATVAQRAKPLIASVCRDIVWPLTVATASGSSMLIRETTDRQSPLALEQNDVDTRIPILTSALGRAYLAFCPASQREAIIDLLSRSTRPEDRLAHDRQELERLLNETRTQGYALATRARRISEETSIAIPIKSPERVLATLMVRFSATAVPLRVAIDQFLPRMREVAITLEREI